MRKFCLSGDKPLRICTNDHHSNTTLHLSSLDIVEYARKIGIVVEEEKELLPLAKEALNTRLPECWKPW